MRRLQEIDAGVLVGFFGPLAAYLVWWKLQRLLMLPQWPGLWVVDLLRPELLLHAGLLSGGGALLARYCHRPRPIRVGLALTYATLGAVEFLCHQHFTTTGAAMDGGLFWYALKNLEGATAAFGELTLPAALLGALLLVAPMPWVLSRPAPMVPVSGAWKAGLIAVALLLLSLAPPLGTTAPRSLARHTTSHLLLSTFDSPPEPLKSAPWSPIQITLEPTYNLVIVVLESVRYRSTSMGSPTLGSTPFMEQMSRDSLTATHAYALIPHSTKAMVPLLCGVPPDLGLAIHESTELPLDCLPKLLGRAGYRTVHFRSATEHFENWRGLCEQLGFEDFFPPEEMDTTGFAKANYFGYEDDIMLEPSRAWLEAEPGKPFFAFYLAGTPHHDYAVPARDGEERRWSEDEDLDGYLRAVNYTDGFVERLLTQLEELGLLQETVVLIVGDHGEGFGEHLPRQHNTNPYEEGMRVPLLLQGPGIEAGRIEQPTSHLDLLPTLLEALGARVQGDLPGHSLLHPLPERTVFGSCWYNARCIVSWRGRDKHIHHFGDLPDERFDLNADTLERQRLPADPEAIDEVLNWYRETRGRWRASKPSVPL